MTFPPDPSMPDPNTAPAEPIEHHVARIEAAGAFVLDDTPVICSAGCEMVPSEILPAGSTMPLAVGYQHQMHCRLYGTDEA